MIRLGFKDLEYYALLRFRNEFVFSDWHPQYFLIPPLCPATIEVDTNRHARLFRAPVANISLTLYLFSPDSAKVLIQFLNTLVAFARDMFFRTSRGELLEGHLPSGIYRMFQWSILKSFTFSVGTYLIQFKVEFSLAKRGIVNEHKGFFVINRGVRLVQTNSSPTSLSRIKHFCRRILSLKRFVFFRHDRSRYFLLVHFVCPKSI